jgi:hypothetical protein
VIAAMPGTKTSLGVFVAALAVAGCSGHGSLCEDIIDCVGGNDQDQEACVVELDVREEVADIEGCSDDYAALYDCQEEAGHCSGSNWVDDGKCGAEQEKYDRCRN